MLPVRYRAPYGCALPEFEFDSQEFKFDSKQFKFHFKFKFSAFKFKFHFGIPAGIPANRA